MRDCETCLMREYNDDLICCAVNKLHYEFVNLLKQIPIFGESIKEYHCQAYEMDKSMTGFPFDTPENSKCSLYFYSHNKDDAV